jgi:MTH538 TIR-like domain (DUF1863)
MAYRTGTYIAFAADGNEDFTKSDIKYYNLMKGWASMKDKEFDFINPHEKGAALRKFSKEETIKATLRDRMKMSKRLILLVGDTTRLDKDFVPYEIEYAIDKCQLPIIVCYVTERNRIVENCPQRLKDLLPKSLLDRINAEKVKTIHIPFRELIITKAIEDYDHNNQPKFSFSLFSKSVYDKLYPNNDI